LADKAAKTTIPFSSDPNQVVKIDEPFKKIDDIHAAVKNKIKQDNDSVENSQPAQVQQEQTVNAEASQQSASTQPEQPASQPEEQSAQLTQPPAQDGSITPVAQQAPVDLKVEEDAVIQGKIDKHHKAKAFWKWFKGEPAYDAALLAMWSYHTKYDDRSTINERNELWGAQYAGFIFGTFRNTFSHRSYMAGAARRVWKKDIYKGFGVDLQYKAGWCTVMEIVIRICGCTP
jgi:hypothetical protein